MVIGNTKPKPMKDSLQQKAKHTNRDVRVTTKKFKYRNNFENIPKPDEDNLKKSSIDINEFQDVTLEQMRFSKINPWDTITGSILEPSSMKSQQFWKKINKYQMLKSKMEKQKRAGFQYYEDRVFPFQYITAEESSKGKFKKTLTKGP